MTHPWIVDSLGALAFEWLAAELSGAELQSVLLEVMQRRAAAAAAAFEAIELSPVTPRQVVLLATPERDALADRVARASTASCSASHSIIRIILVGYVT